MKLISSAYSEGGAIPARSTCDGGRISPPLSWTGVPPDARSLALILHDPDAPRPGGFTHWIVYNLDPHSNLLPEGIPARTRLGGSVMQGRNDAGKDGYFGPCPPSGTHRYVLTLYALNTVLDLEPGASEPQVLAAMKGHIIETAVLIGAYTRK